MNYQLNLTEDEIIALHRLVSGDYLYSLHRETIKVIMQKIEEVKPELK